MIPASHLIAAQVAAALQEDIGPCDWTAHLIAEDTASSATVIARQDAVLCGQAWFDEVFRQVDAKAVVQWQVKEGEQVVEGQVLCQMTGSARSLLTAERSALNYLQTLSAVATETRRYVDLVAHTAAKIYDTRKTLPGMRLAQKYAVTVGGGQNQRLGLYDGILIKENHILAAGNIATALTTAKRFAPADVSIQIEVETLNELEQALQAGATSVLLDNMTLADLRAAVALTGDQAVLEASGGVSYASVQAIAERVCSGFQLVS